MSGMSTLLTLGVLLIALGLPCWAFHRGLAALPGLVAEFFADLRYHPVPPRFSLGTLLVVVALAPPIIAAIGSIAFVL
jgi:hypothetical protein